MKSSITIDQLRALAVPRPVDSLKTLLDEHREVSGARAAEKESRLKCRRDERRAHPRNQH